MTQQFFDVIVAKEYETTQNGTVTKKTAWNRVGRAWPAKSGGALNFEFYFLPGQRYVVNMQPNQEKTNE